jgi:uncharacterized RDD family membrane protein YckC
MKCPKCGYLGFETSDRCRNCGYDFSLAAESSGASELPLHATAGPGEALADLALSHFEPTPPSETLASLDLDRIIGSDVDHSAASSPAAIPESPRTRRSRTSPDDRDAPDALSARHDGALPLFHGEADDTPLITTPRPVRPPLAVRRPTPEIPRSRTRRVTPRPGEGELEFPPEAEREVAVPSPQDEPSEFHSELAPAASLPRLLASAIDIVLLGAINAAVLYLTLALAGLDTAQIALLPLLPLAAFFVILDGGYLVAFIAASGQTIGKMLTGVKVVRNDGGRVDIPGAFLRAMGCGVAVLTAGLAYLPAFLTADRRALQDRMAGTRVISAR